MRMVGSPAGQFRLEAYLEIVAFQRNFITHIRTCSICTLSRAFCTTSCLPARNSVASDRLKRRYRAGIIMTPADTFTMAQMHDYDDRDRARLTIALLAALRRVVGGGMC